ncbi:MAG TPA: putative capsular polysaccharide synthesis family protein [Caulobacteraceae bacterium]|nr:putative capsular polysaccharide synthesis family protein [Caulobacteraceae bacterium]
MKSRGGPVIVHQMAKVASIAWVEAARPASDLAPVHVHWLADRNLDALAANLARPPDQNNFVNPLIPRDMLRKGKRGQLAIEAARARGETIRVVTGMRDPVARSISLVAFFADFVGRAGGGLSVRDGADAEAVCSAIAGLWTAVLDNAAPANSFDWLLWKLIGAYRSWFEEEFASVWGVDVLAGEVRHGEGAQRLTRPGLEVLAYRTEDMNRDAPVRAALETTATCFLGLETLTLREVNTAATRRSYPLYRATRDHFRLPESTLKAIYDAPAIRHFYGPGEIAAMKGRWGAAALTSA